MKLLILGGGSCQLNAIRRAKEKGHTVIVADYYQDAPGKKIADSGELASTFDIEACLKAAEKYNVDGVLTSGTDQPVYTTARVVDKLGLPVMIDVSTAKAATNKRQMKEKFKSAGIPTVEYTFLSKGFSDRELNGFDFPVVVKPLDSQGQRGVYKLHSIADIRDKIGDVLSYSREDKILLEEYYASDEITVSGWVEDSKLYMLTVTDRIRYENKEHIGICSAHYFPSHYLAEYYRDIEEISEKIVDSFDIKKGPVYFQILFGSKGIKVNEIACRIGGAYEDIIIPYLTGVDILEMAINSALGLEYSIENLKKYKLADNKIHLTVQLFFARPGKIARMTDIAVLKELPGVIGAGFNFKIGEEIREIVNATQRAGYLIVTGESRDNLEENIIQAFGNLKIYDQFGNNLVMQSIGRNTYLS